jgi:hypothetical protein
MRKEGLTSYEAQMKRVCFMEKFVGEGGLERMNMKEMGQNIALVSILNKELAGREIGKIFPKPSDKPLFRQEVNRINKKFLKEAWKCASPRLQVHYPLQELFIKKPNPLNETNARIERRIFYEGANVIDVGKEEGSSALTKARHTLDKHGIEIPLVPKKITNHEILKAKVAAAKTNGELQEILDALDRYSLIADTNCENEERILTKLTHILKKAGFCSHRRSKFFVEKLEEKDIPIKGINASNGKSKYKHINWVTFIQCEGEIIKTSEDDPDLRKFKKV